MVDFLNMFGKGIAALGGPADNLSITVFPDDDTLCWEVIGVAAHELGHQVARAKLGNRVVGGILDEGVTKWAAEEFFVARHGLTSLDYAFRGFIADGTYIPFA